MNAPTLIHYRRLVLPRQDTQAIFWRGGWSICHVRVMNVLASEKALIADGEPIFTPGLIADARPFLRLIVAHWDDFEQVQGNWANRQLRWKLFFDAEILNAVFKIVAKLPSGQNFVDDAYVESLVGKSRIPQYRRNLPGPIFRELVDYLRDSELNLFGWLNDLD